MGVHHESTAEMKEGESHVESRASQMTDETSDEQNSLWQNVKKYRKVVCITLGLTSAILLFGYDTVIVGTVSGMPTFQ